MNRVVLCGRLAARPKLAYTRCGVAIATLRVRVERAGPGDSRTDEIEGFALRTLAEELAFWGERGFRVNLEGRLVRDTWLDDHHRPQTALRVYFERGYFVDPVKDPPPEPTFWAGNAHGPELAPRTPAPPAVPGTPASPAMPDGSDPAGALPEAA